MIERTCPLGDAATVAADDIDAFGEAFFAHVRSEHADLPYPDEAVRNYGAGLARMTGSEERLEHLGTIEVHPVTEDRIDDWLDLFDHDVFAGKPEWSACYCTEPHLLQPDDRDSNRGTWREKRAHMVERFRTGATQGYLAYVDGRPAGWVNASTRDRYSLFQRGDDQDACTIGIACFAIAPPYRGHGVAAALLDRVVADAAARGADWLEAYPFLEVEDAGTNFRGARELYDERGFTEVKVRARDTVVRRPAKD